MKRNFAFTAVLLAFLLVGGFYYFGGSQTPSSQPALESLTTQNVVDVKSAFNAAKNEVRVLLLLSPT